jgi:hypothetical protein
MLDAAAVALIHRPAEPPPIAWQWTARQSWIDPISREYTDYLVGFATEARAREYGRRIGWCG